MFKLLCMDDYKFKTKSLVVGRIGKTYGVHGWLRVVSFTEKFSAILNYQPWLIKMHFQWIKVYLENSKRYYGNSFLVKIKTVHSRESAKIFSGCKICIDMSQLPLLNNGEYYWNDLIGCQVIEQNKNYLGMVVDLIETGSNDVLVVHNLNNNVLNQTYLIPVIEKQVIKNIDLVTRVINIDWNCLE